MAFTRNNYTVEESFTADNGREYVKVRWKGIGQTGYVSRIAGPGRTISEDWYREKKREEEDEGVTPPPPRYLKERVVATYAKQDTHDTMGYGANDKVTVEIEIAGLFDRTTSPDDREVTRTMHRIASLAAKQLPFVDTSGDVSISRDDVSTDINTHRWFKGAPQSTIVIDFKRGPEKTYDVDPNTPSIDW